MIKTKNTISSNRITKKSIRPYSSGANLSKKANQPRFINTIISSLQRNVKDLKNYYEKEELTKLTISKDKSQKGFRIKRGLVRNSSQSNINLKNEDRSQHDIFQIRNQYLKAHGRISNSILELYEFYKKNIQKREKSTRIMASMELSNGGQSISGGKESLLKHSQLLNHRQIGKKDKNQYRIDQKHQESNNLQASSKSPIQAKKAEKTSQLANQLISKGCYNIMNIANLLNCKKYRLTKQKQQSFKKTKNHKAKLVEIVQAKQKSANKENSRNRSNIIIKQELEIAIVGSKSQKKNQYNNEIIDVIHSPQLRNKPEISFKTSIQPPNDYKNSNSKSFQCSSISKQDKDIEKRIFQGSSVKKDIENEKILSKIKLEQLINLQESPIVPKNTKQFQKSKYYVKPLPQKKNELQDMNSISLRSTSRIIDIDSLPFEL